MDSVMVCFLSHGGTLKYLKSAMLFKIVLGFSMVHKPPTPIDGNPLISYRMVPPSDVNVAL